MCHSLILAGFFSKHVPVVPVGYQLKFRHNQHCYSKTWHGSILRLCAAQAGRKFLLGMLSYVAMHGGLDFHLESCLEVVHNANFACAPFPCVVCRRDKLRGLIKDTFQARTQLKLLKDQFEELKAHLSGFADAYIAQKEISTPDDPTDMRHLQKLSDNLVENFKTSFTLATREQAIKELKNQDAAAGEWTSEDPEYPSGAQK